MPKKERKQAAERLRAVYLAGPRSAAEQLAHDLVAEGQKSYPKAATCLLTDLDALFALLRLSARTLEAFCALLIQWKAFLPPCVCAPMPPSDFALRAMASILSSSCCNVTKRLGPGSPAPENLSELLLRESKKQKPVTRCQRTKLLLSLLETNVTDYMSKDALKLFPQLLTRTLFSLQRPIFLLFPDHCCFHTLLLPTDYPLHQARPHTTRSLGDQDH